ncbi:hypothetical protein [Marinobacter confluentis]|uniref:Uncharacterized protein n=1 Tax=Marinobacter confluentis TaxID=1697557 RepID=A0A4Z1C5R4_9GAMM|nr:hypothetical protein [Marinobacter confluentis]TGN40670.1 hypothetical protein E5Q11_10535 [Marinobacter confluentis]
MHDHVFPKINELCVFVVTVLLYATIIISPELHEFLGLYWQELLQDWERKWSRANTLFLMFEFVGSLIFGFVFLAIIFLGPLFLPFTKRDIRAVCICILWLDAALIIYWNSQTRSEFSFIQAALILYWGAWLVYSYFVLRADSTNGVKRLINNEQTTPVTALLISGYGCIFLLIFKLLLGWWWLDSYMAAVFMALLAARFGERFLSGIEDKEGIS